MDVIYRHECIIYRGINALYIYIYIYIYMKAIYTQTWMYYIHKLEYVHLCRQTMDGTYRHVCTIHWNIYALYNNTRMNYTPIHACMNKYHLSQERQFMLCVCVCYTQHTHTHSIVINTHIHTWHTDTHTHTYNSVPRNQCYVTYMHALHNTCIHAYNWCCTYTCIHYNNTYIHAHMHTCIQYTKIHTCIHAEKLTCICAMCSWHPHTHTNIHTYALS
jgi:hypothetical protein